MLFLCCHIVEEKRQRTKSRLEAQQEESIPGSYAKTAICQRELMRPMQNWNQVRYGIGHGRWMLRGYPERTGSQMLVLRDVKGV
jgi:hypothetical protein